MRIMWNWHFQIHNDFNLAFYIQIYGSIDALNRAIIYSISVEVIDRQQIMWLHLIDYAFIGRCSIATYCLDEPIIICKSFTIYLND